MHAIWTFIGRLAFWLVLPLLHLYLRFGGERTRVLIVQGDTVLVVKGWLHDGTWSLPGGGLHHNETPVEGACREVLEETGARLTADELTYLGKAQQNQRGLRFTYHQFVTHKGTPQKLQPPRWEITEARFLPITALNDQTAQAHVLDTIAAWRAHR